jgi:hypothetical protein
MQKTIHTETQAAPMIDKAGVVTIVHIVTVLSVTEGVDCRAYRGVTPDISKSSHDEREAFFELVLSRGDKVPEREARDMFHVIDVEGLRYRK